MADLGLTERIGEFQEKYLTRDTAYIGRDAKTTLLSILQDSGYETYKNGIHIRTNEENKSQNIFLDEDMTSKTNEFLYLDSNIQCFKEEYDKYLERKNDPSKISTGIKWGGLIGGVLTGTTSPMITAIIYDFFSSEVLYSGLIGGAMGVIIGSMVGAESQRRNKLIREKGIKEFENLHIENFSTGKSAIERALGIK